MGKGQRGFVDLSNIEVNASNHFSPRCFSWPNCRKLYKYRQVDKIVAGIVGRVDVDHLYLAVISRLQQLQNLQIVTLDVEILGSVPIHAFLRAGAQGAGGALLSQPQAVRFALPLKLVLLKVVVDVFTAQRKQLTRNGGTCSAE